MNEKEGRLWSELAEVSALGAPFAVTTKEDSDGEHPDRSERVAEVVETLVESVEEEDFYAEHHRVLFRAIRRVHEQGEPVDVVTVSEELKSSGDLEAAGGMPYLAQLVDAVPTAANLEAHIQVLRRHHARRKGVEVLREAERGLTDGASPEEVLDVLQEELRATRTVLPANADDGPRTIREILDDPDFGERPAVVLDRLAWAGRTTLFAGREKSGKSSLLRYAVARCSRGKKVWGGVPIGGPLTVLWYGEEHKDDVAADLHRLGADIDRVHYRDMRMIPGDRIAALTRNVETIAPEVVVVDTLPRIAAPRRPKSGESEAWEPIMGELGALAVAAGAAFVLNHHATKADGSYRDSTAIGAGVDCILEMRRTAEGSNNRRDVTAYPRSAIRVQDFSYVMVGSADDPRFELLDDSLPRKERVRRFVERNQPCIQGTIIDGVEGRTTEIRDDLQELEEEGEVEKREDGRSLVYRTPKKPQGKGSEEVGKESGNESTGNGGATVSERGESPKGAPPRETEAEPVDDETQLDPDDVVQVEENFPRSPRRTV